MPINALKLVALSEQNGPENIEDALLLPAHEGAIDGRAVAELQREMVPLAACPQAVDDAVERMASIGTRAAHAVGRIINSQDFLNQLPEWVGSVPDRRQRFLFGCGVFDRFSLGGHHAQIIGVWLLLLEPRLLQ